MGIRLYKPTSAARRYGSVLTKDEITKHSPERSLTVPLKKHGGRNNLGRTTSRFRGGGAKRKYRLVDFKRRKDDVAADVTAIEYDPNRSANIALIQYEDGEKAYILHPVGLKVGDKVRSGPAAEPKVGNALPLRFIPQGLQVHNVELQTGQGAKLVRAAGAVAQLSAKVGDYCTLILPSGEMRLIHGDCRATIGQVANLDHQNVVIGKAGRKRHMGRRPHNRGTSMNPIAHPMGGGEGRTGGGRHPCGPKGKLSKGGKTRNKRKVSQGLIIRGRKRGKHVSGTSK